MKWNKGSFYPCQTNDMGNTRTTILEMKLIHTGEPGCNYNVGVCYVPKKVHFWRLWGIAKSRSKFSPFYQSWYTSCSTVSFFFSSKDRKGMQIKIKIIKNGPGKIIIKNKIKKGRYQRVIFSETGEKWWLSSFYWYIQTHTYTHPKKARLINC